MTSGSPDPDPCDRGAGAGFIPDTPSVGHGPLDGVRVLDLADETGAQAGRMLAELGADVLKVEPPGGESARARPPFYTGTDGVRRSLSWAAANVGKRSACLDLGSEDGRRRFLDLVEDADIVIETLGEPGMTARGLGYDVLRAVNPRIVHTSITAYGSDGPYSSFVASDIALQAMGAHSYVTGDPDCAPLSINASAAYAHGGAEGAAASLVAYYEMLASGAGQHVDVSIEQCVVWTLLNSTMTWQLAHRNDQRGGAYRKERGQDLVTRFVWECSDGYVHFVPVGGGGGHARSRSYAAFAQWMVAEGFDDPILFAQDWNGVDTNRVTQSQYDELAAQIDQFLRTRSVAELYDFAVRNRVLLAPVMSVAEILDDEHLEIRDAWSPVTLPGLADPVRYPAPFARFTATPLVPPRFVAQPGEHDDAIAGAGTADGASQ
jgi:crotonobetainyl-CoA:carnitine CoA-transferase CaiB-like acyl-CoA transferase